MFRVSFKFDGLSAQKAKPSTRVPHARIDVDRAGDWAYELQGAHERLTKEDICETFKDKFRPSKGKGRGRSVA